MSPELEWSFDPWRESPRRAVLALAAAIVCIVLVLAAQLPLVASLALVLACAGAFASGLTPVRCQLDGEGITRRGWFGAERRAWAEVRRATWRPDGVLLSPFGQPHRLDAWRALLLPLPRAERERLSDSLAAALGRHGL